MRVGKRCATDQSEVEHVKLATQAELVELVGVAALDELAVLHQANDLAMVG